jgi:hypothetical protein
MGLDSYIYRVEKDKPSPKEGPFDEILDEVWYARKANALHKWFVDNLQNGEDECQISLIPQRKFEELKIILDKISDYWYDSDLKHLSFDDRFKEIKDKCSELLPTQSGFFFGPIEYDYYSYIYPILDLLIEIEYLDMEKYNYYYHASW